MKAIKNKAKSIGVGDLITALMWETTEKKQLFTFGLISEYVEKEIERKMK
jgi:hypothetical protein